MNHVAMLRRLAVAFATASLLFLPGYASAQSVAPKPGTTSQPDLKSWDATGCIGWHNRPVDTGLYSVRANSLFAGAGVGHYWTEHVKTEIEIGSAGKVDTYYYDPSVSGALYGAPARMTVTSTQVSAAQVYQFFHNAWFHPFVGAGLVLDREHAVAARSAQQITTYSYENGHSVPQTATIPAWSKDSIESRLSGFVLTGFKTYLSPHSFFRADLRVTFGSTVRASNARVGFGIDF